MYWQIGKNVYEKQDLYENVIQKYSDYYTYLFGNSFQFTRENIHLMKRFYMNYPIYTSHMEKLSWSQYKLLLKILDKNERQFYYYLNRFFNSTYEETLDFIYNKYYSRI